MAEKIIILDFGSQVTQLIGRRLRAERLLRDLPVQQGSCAGLLRQGSDPFRKPLLGA